MNGGPTPSEACKHIFVLRQEFEALHDETLACPTFGNVSSDPPPVLDLSPEHLQLYERIHGLPGDGRTALCLSGGGIRSAAFNLGILQGLAQFGLLQRFSYLSTVSGGGYIGAWLSAWRRRAPGGLASVIAGLSWPNDGPGGPPEALANLRHDSSYLTPRAGLMSPDTWTALGLTMRNLLLNNLIVLPLVAAILLVPKLLASAAHCFGRSEILLWLSAALLLLGWTANALRRPSWYPRGDRARWMYLWAPRVGVGLVLAAAVVFAFGTAGRSGSAGQLPDPSLVTVGITAATGAAIGLAAFVLALGIVTVVPPTRTDDDVGVTMATAQHDTRDLLAIAASAAGAMGGAFVGLGFCLADALSPGSSKLALVLTFGPLWLMTGYFIADAVYLALAHRPGLPDGQKWNDRWGDEEREWQGRSNGYLSMLVFGVTALTAISLFGSPAWHDLLSGPWWHKIGAAFGVVTSGLASVGLGGSPLTKADGSPAKNKFPTRLVLVVATPIFAAFLLIALSAAIDRWVFSAPLLEILDGAKPADTAFGPTRSRGLIAAAALALLSLIAARFVNINRFSLHDIYRQRLIREFLGATNLLRKPDPWTGFNTSDDLPLAELWPPRRDWVKCLYPLFNATLNTVGESDRLRWPERKGASFVFTPAYCGSAAAGIDAFRPTGSYAEGVLVGSAMAISGAAAAPNAGYCTIPGLSLLMTLFNIRLGAWAGNPSRAKYHHRGPRYALRALVEEALARTTADTAYVYLSDGGHFDNLGLYEVLRRRCRYIVVSDAGCDPDYAFADLGNAARRAAIDLGIRIHFDHLDLRKRSATPIRGVHAALGVIDYPEMEAGRDRHARGFLLYLKAGYRGSAEPPDVNAYALANPAFPHESTANQFFDEQQFESYRSLGRYMIQDLAKKVGFDPRNHPASLQAFFDACERYLTDAARDAAVVVPAFVQTTMKRR
jgi:hypothetical protein